MFFKRRNSNTLIHSALEQHVTLKTQDKSLLQKLSLISLSKEDLQRLKLLHPIINENMSIIV